MLSADNIYVREVSSFDSATRTENTARVPLNVLNIGAVSPGCRFSFIPALFAFQRRTLSQCVP
jgi:hypothetical protein